MSLLFSAFTRKREEILKLDIRSVSPRLSGSPPAAARAYIPNHRFVVGSVPGAFASLQVTEQQAKGRMTAAVAVSFPFLKGDWQAQFPIGDLRLFALNVDKVRRGHATATHLNVVPGVLAFIVYLDERLQKIFFAVDHRGPLGVHMIPTLPLNSDELSSVIDSLQESDPGE
jgi:hypothetical protein